MAKRKSHTAAFKAQVALATVKGDRTVNEVAAQFGVHPTLIHDWKKKLLAGAATIFESGAKAAPAPGAGHRVYPYLLRGVAIERPGHVWSADITYVPLPGGFMYLAATIDWYSRLVVAWRLSNTLDGSFCQEMLEAALATGTPEVFNTDQGVQFTARAFTDRVERAGVAVSMDGRGRCLDNVFVERLWRSVKYEDVYLRGYESVPALERGLAAYF